MCREALCDIVELGRLPNLRRIKADFRSLWEEQETSEVPEDLGGLTRQSVGMLVK